MVFFVVAAICVAGWVAMRHVREVLALGAFKRFALISSCVT